MRSSSILHRRPRVLNNGHPIFKTFYPILRPALPRINGMVMTSHVSPQISRTATTMTTVHNTNEACCSIPPVQSDYTPKGNFKSIGQFQRVYVTGTNTKKALVCVYDIFGFFPQTQQGADILASTLDVTVYMPDFFEPDGPFPLEKYPPTTEEAKKELQDFFGGIASPPATVEKLLGFGKTIREQGVETLGAYGFCWGGKVTIVASAEGTPFDATAIVHPAMLSPSDAEKITIPFAMYISKDEPIEEYEKIVKILEGKPFAAKNDSKNYSNMFHGWAAARGDLTKEDNKKEYEDVYSRLATFFKNAFP
ncbi:hypothetical protein DL96DRAFT_1575833 [Flagelloscypha sp. PMI_526]|nr:hypothetical protein DL96DRAFT_1575833 [Flagelloscypha sp. PMI_526]